MQRSRIAAVIVTHFGLQCFPCIHTIPELKCSLEEPLTPGIEAKAIIYDARLSSSKCATGRHPAICRRTHSGHQQEKSIVHASVPTGIEVRATAAGDTIVESKVVKR